LDLLEDNGGERRVRKLIECRKTRYYAGKFAIMPISITQQRSLLVTLEPIGRIPCNNQAELKDFLKVYGFQEFEIIDR